MKTKTSYNKIRKIIDRRHNGTALDDVIIKLKHLSHYFRSKEIADNLHKESLTATMLGDAYQWPDDRYLYHDWDGDLSLTLRYAENSLIAGAAQRSFGSVLGLILIVEVCYEPTVGCPSLINPAMQRFQRLACRSGMIPAALLHDFLEVEEPLETWFSHHVTYQQLIRGDGFVTVPPEAPMQGDTGVEEDAWDILLTPVTAARLACATPTIRGRKVKACLMDPGVKLGTYEEQDPALMELLFSPPARGLASLWLPAMSLAKDPYNKQLTI